MIHILYRIYQFIVCILIILPATVLTALITAIGSLLGSASFWGYFPGKIWSIIVCRSLLIPVTIEGRENIDRSTSYVFVANHQGSMDIFLIYGFLGRNFKWMMKQSLRKMPLIGFACAKAKHIFVDKSGPKKIQETYDNARATLRNGISLVVFPEGARTFTGRMGIFRKGAFQLADELQLPVVPITIDGSFDVLPRTKGFNFVHRHPMRLIIHRPIPPTSKSPDNVRSTTTQAYETIMQSLPEHHRGYEKNDDQ